MCNVLNGSSSCFYRRLVSPSLLWRSAVKPLWTKYTRHAVKNCQEAMCKVDETSWDTKQGQEKIISETNKIGPYFGVGRKTFWPAFFWEYALVLSKTSIFAFFENSYTRVNRITHV